MSNDNISITNEFNPFFANVSKNIKDNIMKMDINNIIKYEDWKNVNKNIYENISIFSTFIT